MFYPYYLTLNPKNQKEYFAQKISSPQSKQNFATEKRRPRLRQ